MIVPPAAGKRPYYGNRTLQALWRLAGQALGEAEDLVLMGFSLPPTDLLVSLRLTTTLPGESLITPVNRSGEVVERIRTTFNTPAGDNSCLNLNFVPPLLAHHDNALPKWVETYACWCSLEPKSAAQAVDSGPCGRVGRVAIDVPGDRYAAVPQQVGDGFDMPARLQPRHRRAVPQRVHPDILDARLRRRRLDGPQDVARLDRGAELGGEHQPAVGPPTARVQAFGDLAGPPGLQQRHNRRGDRHRPPQARRLGFGDDQALADPRQRGRDLQRPVREVQVFPPQRQRLTATQTGRRDQRQHRPVTQPLRGAQDGSNPVGRQVAGLGACDPRP